MCISMSHICRRQRIVTGPLELKVRCCWSPSCRCWEPKPWPSLKTASILSWKGMFLDLMLHIHSTATLYLVKVCLIMGWAIFTSVVNQDNLSEIWPQNLITKVFLFPESLDCVKLKIEATCLNTGQSHSMNEDSGLLKINMEAELKHPLLSVFCLWMQYEQPAFFQQSMVCFRTVVQYQIALNLISFMFCYISESNKS